MFSVCLWGPLTGMCRLYLLNVPGEGFLCRGAVTARDQPDEEQETVALLLLHRSLPPQQLSWVASTAQKAAPLCIKPPDTPNMKKCQRSNMLSFWPDHGMIHMYLDFVLVPVRYIQRHNRALIAWRKWLNGSESWKTLLSWNGTRFPGDYWVFLSLSQPCLSGVNLFAVSEVGQPSVKTVVVVRTFYD